LSAIFQVKRRNFGHMRRLASLAIVLAVLLPTLVTAAPGSGNGNGPGGGGPSEPATGLAGGGPTGPAAGGPAPKGPVTDQGKGKGPDKGDPDDPGIPPTGPATSDQTLARDALESGSTLPLAAILRAALKGVSGRLIDARLLVVNKTAIYRLTLVDGHGVARRLYYDARTARPVGPP
jgi:hypothetical protein